MWDKEEQETLYTSAFSLYKQKNYGQAELLFNQLCLSDPFQEDFWRGFASCLQMQLKWKEAIHAWGVLALLTDKDPIPHFHAAECFFSLHETEEAEKALLQVESRLEANTDSDLLSNITLLKELLATR